MNEPMVVGKSGDVLIVVERADLGQLQSMATQCRLWSPGKGLSTPRPLQVALKWLYAVEEIEPIAFEDARNG